MLANSKPTRLATTHFSLQVCTNRRYFCLLSKKRKLRCGSLAPGAAGDAPVRACPACRFDVRSMTVGRAGSAMGLLSPDSEPRMPDAVNHKAAHHEGGHFQVGRGQRGQGETRSAGNARGIQLAEH